MVMQTWALLVDAYRELNARKLFWITLLISGAVVSAFAAMGLNERGITFLWWDMIPAPILARQVSPPMFYKYLFSSFAIPIWLGWAASILGLVSTAGIIPEFIASGAIELSLSKPIRRTRLLLTKFAAALLFMVLQVAVFSAASFLVIGVRGGSWEPRLFLAVPIMVLFFSYLYCVCVLLGLLTRSTVAALLLTLLFWLGVFGVNTTEDAFLTAREYNSLRIERLESQANLLREQEAKDGKRPRNLDRREEQLSSALNNRAFWERGHMVAFTVKTLSPKTQETIRLLRRALMTAEDRERFRAEDENGPQFNFGGDDVFVSPVELERRVEEAQLGRSIWWVIGTSLGFEAVVLGVAAWVFARKDF